MKNELEKLIKEVAGVENFSVEHPTDLQMGDYSTNVGIKTGKAREIFALRHKKKDAHLNKGTVAAQKQIFYDTTGFHVQETKIYHLCPECPGFTEIKATGLKNHIHAFTVPFNACPRCHKRAKDSFIVTKPAPQTVVALQDRIEDIYETK